MIEVISFICILIVIVIGFLLVLIAFGFKIDINCFQFPCLNNEDPNHNSNILFFAITGLLNICVGLTLAIIFMMVYN